jgi:hypothetical protein
MNQRGADDMAVISCYRRVGILGEMVKEYGPEPLYGRADRDSLHERLERDIRDYSQAAADGQWVYEIETEDDTLSFEFEVGEVDPNAK